MNFIKKNNLFSHEDTLIIALSGGVDSMVLFSVLYKLKYNLVVCHINHKIRIESDYEYQEIAKLCQKLNIPFHGLELNKIEGLNFQAEARRQRYSFFTQIAKQYQTNIILTAHHLDDMVETSLMKITRGSNLLGYGGIKMLIKNNDIKIIRPLLCVTKQEIYDYANAKKIMYFEDSSNQTDHYTRNKFRHNIIPTLVDINPNLYQEFQYFSYQVSNAFSYIRNNSSKILKNWNNIVMIDEFLKLDQILQFDIIMQMLEEKEILLINQKTMAILDIISTNGNKEINLGNGLFFIKAYNKGFIDYKANKCEYEIVINSYGQYDMPNGDKLLFTKNIQKNNSNYINICYNTIRLPIVVRNRRPGDIIHFSYGDKSLNRHLIDKKIPEYLRDLIPIVLSDNNIIGVIGIGPKKSDTGSYLYWIRSNKNDK